MELTYRQAELEDIPGMHTVRMAVKENVLSNPAIIQPHDYISFLTTRGRGWVCEMNQQIVGFAIADTEEENIWALFILPNVEGQGIGKALQTQMLTWYFANKDYVWLSTSPNTKAEQFYKHTGWKAIGFHGNEVKFEMTKSRWNRLNY